MLGMTRKILFIAILLQTAAHAFFHTQSFSRRATLRNKSTFLRSRDAKWSSDVNEFAERINSGKALVLSAVVGSLGAAPFNVAGAFIFGQGLTAEWEFRTDMLAVCLGLFGVVYRYAVRSDPNPNLKQGVVGAFALTRTLNLIEIPDSCAALPLNCGAPFGYVSYEMVAQGLISGVPSLLAFALSAVALETAFNNDWIGRMK